jgi:hypothetical protein
MPMTTRRVIRVLAMCLVLSSQAVPPQVAEAGPVGRRIARTAVGSKLLKQSAATPAARRGLAAAFDRLRDRATPARPLPKARTVFRYMTRKEAKDVSRMGITSGRHFTTSAGPGRPLGGAQARRRFGLPASPSIRATAKLDAGTMVKHNKVLAGRPGQGELVVVDRVPAASVRRVLRLPK